MSRPLDGIYKITWHDERVFIGAISQGWILIVGDSGMLYKNVEPYIMKTELLNHLEI